MLPTSTLRSCAAILILIASLNLPAFARPEAWLEVRTPHFIVLTNAGEKQGRRIAGQFERMRAVFHKRFPTAHIDAAAPMVVMAVRDKKDFQALEPEAYLAKGQLNLAGYFLSNQDKNYILLRLDVAGDHPYATVYHEYTHFITGRAQQWMPLWLSEGLAEFYQNTEIKDKEVSLGQPDVENIMLLRQNKLLPLPTLLTVDHDSPWYHEENKGSIFYAESWALTHYLEVRDRQNNTHLLSDYARLVSNKTDSITAATQAFGDLAQLQRNLEHYVSQGNFFYFRMQGATEVDDSAFTVRPLSLIQADATRADFLACLERVPDARALLARILAEDPNNISAQETMGYLAFREGKLKEAAEWYEKAVKLDSQTYLAHYYFAAISMREGLPAERLTQIESSLRTAIKLNPAYAAAYDQLAQFYAMRHTNLDEARLLNLRAVELEPANTAFRQNAANLLVLDNRPADAISVLQTALKTATTPEQIVAIQNQIESIERYQAERATWESQYRESATPATETVVTTTTPEPAEPEPHGPRQIARGTLKDVECTAPARLTLTLIGGAHPLHLHSRNYYKIEYSALNYKPSADLKPCRDLNGTKAKVAYFEGATPTEGQIISIEMTK